MKSIAAVAKISESSYKEEVLFPGHEEFDFSLWNKSYKEIWPEINVNSSKVHYNDKYGSEDDAYADFGNSDYSDVSYLRNSDDLIFNPNHNSDYSGAIRCL